MYRRLKRKGYRNKYRVIRRISIILAVSVLTLLFTAMFICWNTYHVVSEITPCPETVEAYDDEGFPKVDWDYWAEINPDIIGWVTVPNTHIDSPLVVASPDDPQFYLTHNVYRNWNWLGCPYLDASCAEDGLLSYNSVIFGHNTGWDTEMFADFALFSDSSYAQNHKEILLQTPLWKSKLSVVAVDVIYGQEPSKQTLFKNNESFFQWYKEQYYASDIILDQPFPIDRLYTFVTCSYNSWTDERTLVYTK